MIVDDQEMTLEAGDTLFIKPKEWHQIFQSGSEELEFLVICAPAWDPANTIYEE